MIDDDRTYGVGRAGTLVPSYSRQPRNPTRSVGAGLLLRGVVLRVYPYGGETDQNALYCDVLVYSGHPGVRAWPLHQVLVTQDQAGLQSGDVWIPQPTTRNIAAGALGLDGRRLEPSQLDGDHVIVGFLDDNRSLPVVLRSVPHPRADAGKTDAPDALGTLPLGYRLRPTASDLGGAEPRQRPRLWKHNGTFFGVDAAGNWVLDARRAHQGYAGDGTAPGGGGFLPDGSEVTGAAVDGSGDAVSGNGTIRLAAGAKLRIEFDDGRAIELRDRDGRLDLDATTVRIGTGATEHAVHGDAWGTARNSLNTVVIAQLAAALAPIQALLGGLAPAPADPTGAALEALKGLLLAEWNAVNAALTAVQAAHQQFETGPTAYLSADVTVK